MRVLLDERLPRKLKHNLPGHDMKTVPEAGWAGIKNGNLLRLAEANFDVFVTIDQNLPYQQNLASLNLAVVILVAADNKVESLIPLMPSLLTALDTIRAHQLVTIP